MPYQSAFVARPQFQEPPPRMDGFSEDGLSYQVATDFPKIAAQALADYEARFKSPRNDIWGNTLAEDRPENLKATILDPISQVFGIGVGNSSPLRTYKTPGGGIIGVNPVTGLTKMLAPNGPEKTPDLSYAEKQRIGGLYRERAALAGKSLRSETDNLRLDEIGKAIAALEAPPTVAPQAQAAPQAPNFWEAWPQQGSFIGTPGGTNSFSGTTAPFVAPRVSNRQNPIKVLNIRQK